MRTYVHTKVYEIRRSAKGWSEAFRFFFSYEKAVKHCRELQKWAQENGYKENFRIYERPCEDSIIYTIESND